MKGLTAYALGVELGRSLAGARIISAERFESGMSIEVEEADRIRFLHVFFISRKAYMIPLGRPVIPGRYSVPVLAPVNGSVITGIRPLGLDRSLRIDLESRDSWGQVSHLAIRIDLSPGSRAVTLFELPEDRLIGSVAAVRSRKPASPDETRSPKRWSLFSLPDTYPAEIISRELDAIGTEIPAGSGKSRYSAGGLAGILVSMIDGIDPVLSSVLVRRYPDSTSDLWNALKEIAAKVSSGSYTWKIYDIPESGSDGNCALYPFPLPIPCRPEGPEGYLDGFATLADEKVLPSYSAITRRKALSAIKKEIKRSERLISNLSEDLLEADRTEELRMYGNLLSTFRHLVRPGMSEIELRDFSGTGTVMIPLDPALGPDGNIKKYFRRAKKGEKGKLVIRNHRKEAEKELKKKEELFERISKMTGVEELLELLPETRTPDKDENKKGGDKMFRRYALDPAHTVFVGRNDKENDFLTHRFASPNDLWFHAQGSSGSHVILRSGQGSTPQKYIERAAEIAAWFSKAKNSGTVPVIYTEKRYVRKPRRSKPGTAVCTRGQTIFVAPKRPDEPAKKVPGRGGRK